MNRSSFALAAFALVPFILCSGGMLACDRLGGGGAPDASPAAMPTLVPLTTAPGVTSAVPSAAIAPVVPPHTAPGHPHPGPTAAGEGGVPSGPTAFPFPSSLPSGFPTALPSGFPTALPSGFPSAFPAPPKPSASTK